MSKTGGRVSLTILSSVVGWSLRLPEKSDFKNPLAGREATAGCLLHGSLTAGERLTAAAAERAAERVERAQGDWRSGERESRIESVSRVRRRRRRSSGRCTTKLVFRKEESLVARKGDG